MRLNEAWVVFDGTEPDSKVLGLAATLDAVVRIIDGDVDLDRVTLVVELPYSDAGIVKASARPLYAAVGEEGTPREWAFHKEDVHA